MSPSTLTDRYIWTVTRQLPQESGPDVARELRVTLEEAVEDRVAAGEDPSAAERAAVAELGDPDVLAREYGGRPQHLVGPAVYADYVRLLKVLLAVVLPCVVLGVLITQSLATDRDFGDVLGRTIGAVLQTGVHLVFWTTLVFVIIERSRSESERDAPITPWDPDQLPGDAPWRAPRFGEMAAEVSFSAAMVVLLVWQLSGVGERGVQVLDPQLPLVWKLVLVGLFVLDAAVSLAAWRVGRWTPTLAAVNVLANVVSAVLLVWLLLSDQLLTDLPTVFAERFGTDLDWSVSYPAVAVGIVVICGWDAVASVRRAWLVRDGSARGEGRRASAQ